MVKALAELPTQTLMSRVLVPCRCEVALWGGSRGALYPGLSTNKQAGPRGLLSFGPRQEPLSLRAWAVPDLHFDPVKSPPCQQSWVSSTSFQEMQCMRANECQLLGFPGWFDLSIGNAHREYLRTNNRKEVFSSRSVESGVFLGGLQV